MNPIKLLSSISVLMALPALLHGQVSITDETLQYQQDFDALGVPLMNGEELDWINNVTLQGWYRDMVTTLGEVDNSRTWSGNGSANVSSVPAFWNYGSGFFDSHTNPPQDRAIGMRIVSGQTGTIGLVIRNDSSSPIVAMNVDYRGEQWRRQTADGSTRTLQFQYAVKPTVDTAEFSIYLAEGFVVVEPLNFVSPNNSGLGASGLDGNYKGFVDDEQGTSASANFVELSDRVELETPIAPGEYLVLRWYYVSPEGSGHGMAIDDVDILFEQGEVSTGFNLVVDYIPYAGSVTIDPDLEEYVDGAEIMLTAEPKPWFRFAGWEGEIDDNDPANRVITHLFMNQNRQITANFVARPSLWEDWESNAGWKHDWFAWILDEHFPFIFQPGFGWLYPAPGSTAEDLIAYDYESGEWIHISRDWSEYQVIGPE